MPLSLKEVIFSTYPGRWVLEHPGVNAPGTPNITTCKDGAIFVAGKQHPIAGSQAKYLFAFEQIVCVNGSAK
jgi:hypothetical protein